MGFERDLNIVVKLDHDSDKASGEFFRVAHVVSESFDEGVSGKGVQQGSVQFFPDGLCARSRGQQSRNKAEQEDGDDYEKIENESTRQILYSEQWRKSLGQVGDVKLLV